MKKTSSTKRALIASILMLALCFTALVGTTFAWFTDSVTSSGNKIVAGTLDVDLYMWKSATESVEITNEEQPIFGKGDSLAAQNNAADTLWEPGKTQTVYLSIKNNGSLALKYQVAIVVTDVEKNLNEVLYYTISPDKKFGEVTAWDGTNAKQVVLGNNVDTTDVALDPTSEHFFALSVHMDELADNKYMGGSITFDIKVIATQLASEEDSFDADYDKNAEYYHGSDSGKLEAGVSSVYLVVTEKNNSDNVIGSIDAPAAAIEDDAEVTLTITQKPEPAADVIVGDGEEFAAYDITVTGLKEGNIEPIKVTLTIPTGLDPTTVKLYHHDAEISCDYDPTDGQVTFYTTNFSPFTVIYDAESEYVAPEVPEDEEGNVEYPTATVTYEAQYVNVDLPWESYGQWSPTEGLEANLEAAFAFSCPENVDPAFDYWYCDFFVSLDKDLAANQIFLGGNYGTWGWIGFHNGDVTLEAGTEIPLLGSVAGSWTYHDVAANVGTFLCGVGDVNNALDGATFTVKLRLTNPENEEEYYDVNTVTYKFGGEPVIDGTPVKVENATTNDELASAINGGANYVVLGDGTYSVPSAVAGKDITIAGAGDATVIDFSNTAANVGDANITFENLKITGKDSNTMNGYGIQSTTGDIVYKNCTFENAFTSEFYGNVYYYNCTFVGTYYISTYAVDSATFVGCTFDRTDSRALLVYSHGDNPVEVLVKDCTFKAAAHGTTWAGDWTAAIEVDTTNIPSAGTTVTIENCTYDENYNGIVRDKSTAGKETAVITVDGTVVDNTTIKTTGYAGN